MPYINIIALEMRVCQSVKVSFVIYNGAQQRKNYSNKTFDSTDFVAKKKDIDKLLAQGY